MDKDVLSTLSNEPYKLHIDNARAFAGLISTFISSGEQGVMLWLKSRTCDTYALDVIEHFGLTPGRVANIIKKLEGKGYITRLHDDEDQRRARILLTDDGVAYADEIYLKADVNYRHMIELLGEKDTTDFIRIIKKMLAVC